MHRTATLMMLAALAACRSSPAPAAPKPADAGADGGGYPVAVNALDIAVTGCTSSKISGGAQTCSGSVPFTVTFSPVGAPGLTSFVWDFGDGSPPSSDVAPIHTYALPGTYDVAVKGGSPSTGTIPAIRRGLIAALPVGTGGPCDVDAQCAGHLSCVCKAGDGCGPAFRRGICSTSCTTTGDCGIQAVCAVTLLPPALLAGTTDAGSPWGPLCLADCGNGNNCPPGFVCENFPAVGSGAGGWVRGCLPTGAAGEIGSTCRTAGGTLDDTRCAGGTCSSAARNGFCTASCQPPLTCPMGTACARLAGGQICVPACSPNQPCSIDPSVSCQSATAADAGVDGGLSLVTGDFAQMYCVPGALP